MPEPISGPTFQWTEAQKAALRGVWTPEKRDAMAAKMRAYWASHPAPMKGKSHSEEAKARMRESQLRNWEAIRALKGG